MEQLDFYVIICKELVENNQLSRREAINIVSNMVSFRNSEFSADDLSQALANQLEGIH